MGTRTRIERLVLMLLLLYALLLTVPSVASLFVWWTIACICGLSSTDMPKDTSVITVELITFEYEPVLTGYWNSICRIDLGDSYARQKKKEAYLVGKTGCRGQGRG